MTRRSVCATGVAEETGLTEESVSSILVDFLFKALKY
jgi:hypothetical protein